MEITIESLATVVGATAAVGIILQGLKQVLALSLQWLRRLAVILGIVLMVGMAATAIPDAVNVVAYFVVAAVNGVVVGLAAGAAFDTIKYGDGRTVTN